MVVVSSCPVRALTNVTVALLPGKERSPRVVAVAKSMVSKALSVERHDTVALLDGQFLVPHHTGDDFTVEGGRGDHFPVGKIDIGRCFSVVGEEIEGAAAEVDDDIAILEQAGPDARVVSAGSDGGDVAKIKTCDFEMRHLDAVFECGRFDARSAMESAPWQSCVRKALPAFDNRA